MAFEVKIFKGKDQAALLEEIDAYCLANSVTATQMARFASVVERDQEIYRVGVIFHGGDTPPAAGAATPATGSILIDDKTKLVVGDTFVHYGVTLTAAAAQDIPAGEFLIAATDALTADSIVAVLNGTAAWAADFTAAPDGITAEQVNITANADGAQFNGPIGDTLTDPAAATITAVTGGLGGNIVSKFFSDDNLSDIEAAINDWLTVYSITYLQSADFQLTIDQDGDRRLTASILYSGLEP